MIQEGLPPSPGSYLLILHAAYACSVQVGKLGMLEVRPGFYLYTGSAFGPGGLRGRINHHLRICDRPRWHIDYLRRVGEPVEIWFSLGENLEHAWAGILTRRLEIEIPLSRFGSSDCACRSHLFYLPVLIDIGQLLKISGQNGEDQIRIERCDVTEMILPMHPRRRFDG